MVSTTINGASYPYEKMDQDQVLMQLPKVRNIGTDSKNDSVENCFDCSGLQDVTA